MYEVECLLGSSDTLCLSPGVKRGGRGCSGIVMVPEWKDTGIIIVDHVRLDMDQGEGMTTVLVDRVVQNEGMRRRINDVLFCI